MASFGPTVLIFTKMMQFSEILQDGIATEEPKLNNNKTILNTPPGNMFHAFHVYSISFCRIC